MKCDQCEKEATVHLTQVVEGVVKKIHLCETCAAQSGFDIQGPVSITDILLGMGGEQTPTRRPSSERECPRCLMKRSDFKKSGRLGCPECYGVFSEDLVPLVKAMHRSQQHSGKVPAGEGERARLNAVIAQTQNELDQAIAAEEFEKAAGLRDQLQSLRDQLEQESAGAGR